MERTTPPKRLHELIKAPENLPSSIERRESWDATKPATVYLTPEVLPDGTPCTAATVILRTKGCTWWWKSGCTFCGYFNDVRDNVTVEDMLSQWSDAKKITNDFEGCKMVKVYTSGTFFEDRENPIEWQETVLRETYEMNLHLVVEAQAHLCKDDKLSWVSSIHPGCTVAIGLEAYDDAVLRFHVNKGFNLKTWHAAVERLRKYKLRVKTYLMFKPPFMSEGDALIHSVRWIQEVSRLSDEVSINPMNIQKRTIVDRLHRNREYRPPWLWSLVKMIQDSHNAVKESGCRVIVHPTAGGKIRGAHNCGNCDKEVVAAIERYSVSSEIDEFSDLSCECHLIWSDEINSDILTPAQFGTGFARRGSPLRSMLAP